MTNKKLNELKKETIKKYSDYLKSELESSGDSRKKKKEWEDAEANWYKELIIYSSKTSSRK